MENFRRFVLQEKYRSVRLVAAYLLLVVIVGLVLFWRFPNNVVFANFYGEDGSVYLQNVINKGWLRGAITPFNGYAIVGLYALCGLGWVINVLFLSGGLLTLPVALAVAAIVFMAAVIALPYLLFARTFGRGRMLLVVAASALLPLPMSSHIVIGTIGNQKWVFLYLGFLLVLYRVIHHKKLKPAAIVTVDAVLLIAAYTNSAVYALLPVALLPYLQTYWTKRKREGLDTLIKKELRRKDFLSLIGLGILLVPQVIYVLINGIPKLAGYLDTPFQPAKAIELFVNRTYLFGVTHFVNGHMDDVGALLLFGLLMYFGWRKLQGRERLAFFLGVYAAGMASALFVLNRTGVTDHFHGYSPSGSGPDQFFYAQTLVMYLPLVLVAYAVAESVGKRGVRAVLIGLVAAYLIATGLVSNAVRGAVWRNASVFENDAGIFTDQVLEACKSPSDPVRLTVYPYRGGQFSLYAPLGKICTSELRHYQPGIADLGLRPNNNDHLPITSDKQFTQTFIATQDRLNGVRIFLSNFGKTYRRGEYTLRILDTNCESLIRQAVVAEKLLDNAYYNIRFEPIDDSANKAYCFTINPPVGSYDPIALQRSQPGIYPVGTYTEYGKALAVDVVFMPLFDQKRGEP